MCDKWIGGALKTSSISATLGKNCSGLSKPPFSARYITIKANARGEHIQISQVAVFTYNETTGAISNVAPNGSVSNGKINNLSWVYANIRQSIDGYQGARNYPYIYHSYGESPNNFWQLDLGQDYPIFKVVYYNRADCCQSRAIGMTLSLENGARTKIVKKTVSSASLVQPFAIAEADSVAETPPFTKPHLDNIGTVSFTWDDSDKYAKSKGGRLATEAELINYITKNGGGNLVPTDQWAAVTDGWRGNKDYIQIGTRSGGVGASHLLYYGTANWWYSAAGNPLYAKWVFWMGPD